MPILAPGFRELNYQRTRSKAAKGVSSQDIAQKMNETIQPEDPLTPADINGYLKVQKYASQQMLLRKRRDSPGHDHALA
jgi:hypothetical protein